MRIKLTKILHYSWFCSWFLYSKTHMRWSQYNDSINSCWKLQISDKKFTAVAKSIKKHAVGIRWIKLTLFYNYAALVIIKWYRKTWSVNLDFRYLNFGFFGYFLLFCLFLFWNFSSRFVEQSMCSAKKTLHIKILESFFGILINFGLFGLTIFIYPPSSSWRSFFKWNGFSNRIESSTPTTLLSWHQSLKCKLIFDRWTFFAWSHRWFFRWSKSAEFGL